MSHDKSTMSPASPATSTGSHPELTDKTFTTLKTNQSDMSSARSVFDDSCANQAFSNKGILPLGTSRSFFRSEATSNSALSESLPMQVFLLSRFRPTFSSFDSRSD